ncbi:MAG TPA: ATP-binding protein [Leptolyngbya sp.]|nr:ATP-binding protein [Leptolyngbya sp.]
MNRDALRQIVWQPEESAKLDFKIEFYKVYEPKPTTQPEIQKWEKAKEQQWAELVKDIIALANGNFGTATQEGYLVVGAGDKLKADGTPTLRAVETTLLTRKEVLEKVHSYCQPRLLDLKCEMFVVDGVNLLVISIPPSPYLYRLSKQLKTPKKEFSPHTVLIRRHDGEEIYEASPIEQKTIEQEKQAAFNLSITDERSPLTQGELTLEECDLLHYAQETKELKLLENQAGNYVKTGNRSFKHWEDQEKRIKYLDALDSLEKKELVKHEGGTLYRLTFKGFEAISRISQKH